MSALSDFLTSATGPWWSSGLVGIAGTLLGIGANSRISNQRDEKQALREAEAKLEQNRLDDRRRWEVEIRDYVSQIDRNVHELRGYMYRPEDQEERNAQRLIVRRILSDLDRIRSALRLISPASLYDQADQIYNDVFQMGFARDEEACDAKYQAMIEGNKDLMKAARSALRIPDEI